MTPCDAGITEDGAGVMEGVAVEAGAAVQEPEEVEVPFVSSMAARPPAKGTTTLA